MDTILHDGNKFPVREPAVSILVENEEHGPHYVCRKGGPSANLHSSMKLFCKDLFSKDYQDRCLFNTTFRYGPIRQAVHPHCDGEIFQIVEEVAKVEEFLESDAFIFDVALN